ncbi:uncharacterized protein MCYG_08689 [Microsporum canis CBS 113480]|uniref:Uncharacterized protein n=1 Tax=Arthroderma otae (strain ATCC MYA-4605 / CBS 113480) TaxID=554155 RepID=C5G167_ARTOC|nr:uncharacterized protein MCYG_08689 [Microsporum canis CBS 113480]EEQ35870.1 predicted protein [Microsporum canis CBS 113480]
MAKLDNLQVSSIVRICYSSRRAGPHQLAAVELVIFGTHPWLQRCLPFIRIEVMGFLDVGAADDYLALLEVVINSGLELNATLKSIFQGKLELSYSRFGLHVDVQLHI